MKLSPLQLKNYFLTELTVKAIPMETQSGSAAAFTGMTFSTKVDHAQKKTNPHDWRVCLRITSQPDGKNHYPYTIDMELIGFFEVAPTIKEENIKPLIMANAPALLYGAARELILLVTGHAPYGSIMLPTATFIDEALQNNPDAKPQSEAKVPLTNLVSQR